MIQRIQNVSFCGGTQKLINKTAQKAEELYVSASSNLAGTVNEAKAEKLLKEAKLINDKDTLASRIASLIISKGNIPEEIISGTKPGTTIHEFNFFG